jgi:hypothetical protein
MHEPQFVPALQAAPTASTLPAPAAITPVITSSPTPWQAQMVGPAEAVSARPVRSARRAAGSSAVSAK